MPALNWEKFNKENPRISNRAYELERAIRGVKRGPGYFKKKMDEALLKYGWQICPRCKKGRHPMFTLCKKCRDKQKIEMAR